MKELPTAEEFLKEDEEYIEYIIDGKVSYTIALNALEIKLIEFAKLHVEAMMKDMEQKLLDTLDDHQYLEENVCGVIEEIREYKPDNIK
jgi:hypothetical protein